MLFDQISEGIILKILVWLSRQRARNGGDEAGEIIIQLHKAQCAVWVLRLLFSIRSAVSAAAETGLKKKIEHA